MQKQFKLFEVLKWASLFLEKYNREPQVAQILLQHHLGVNRAQFFALMREEITENTLHEFEQDLIKHATTGVPVQHLIGYKYFYGRKFFVNQDVLIPRPETEELVQKVIQYAEDVLKDKKPLTIVDVGTGSGAIALTLSLELSEAHVYATDISERALIVAKKNANNLNTAPTFMQGDFLEPLIQSGKRADIIVANPPYIAEHEMLSLPDTVKNFDPSLALFAKDDGLFAYKRITHQLPACLNKETGAIFYEIGHHQGQDVKAIIQDVFPNSEPTILQDINKKERIVYWKI